MTWPPRSKAGAFNFDEAGFGEFWRKRIEEPTAPETVRAFYKALVDRGVSPNGAATLTMKAMIGFRCPFCQKPLQYPSPMSLVMKEKRTETKDEYLECLVLTCFDCRNRSSEEFEALAFPGNN